MLVRMILRLIDLSNQHRHRSSSPPPLCCTLRWERFCGMVGHFVCITSGTLYHNWHQDYAPYWKVILAYSRFCGITRFCEHYFSFLERFHEPVLALVCNSAPRLWQLKPNYLYTHSTCNVIHVAVLALTVHIGNHRYCPQGRDGYCYREYVP
jgi:hypothetical protein